MRAFRPVAVRLSSGGYSNCQGAVYVKGAAVDSPLCRRVPATLRGGAFRPVPSWPSSGGAKDLCADSINLPSDKVDLLREQLEDPDDPADSSSEVDHAESQQDDSDTQDDTNLF